MGVYRLKRGLQYVPLYCRRLRIPNWGSIPGDHKIFSGYLYLSVCRSLFSLSLSVCALIGLFSRLFFFLAGLHFVWKDSVVFKILSGVAPCHFFFLFLAWGFWLT